MLGRILLNSMLGGHSRGGMNSIINTAVASAGAAAGAAVVNNLMHKNQQPQTVYIQQRPSQPQRQGPTAQQAADIQYTNTMLGKLALCCYIARVDGSISRDEQFEIDAVASEIMSDPRISEENKGKIRDIANCSNINFMMVQRFLDKADPSTLVSFVNDIDTIANATGGVTPQEEKAIDLFKDYVSKKTGYSFPKKEEKKIATVDLTCSHCGATMELDSTGLKATCQYCGSSKIIDAFQISNIMNNQ